MSAEDYVAWLRQLSNGDFDAMVVDIREVDPEVGKLAVEALERSETTLPSTPTQRPALRINTSCIGLGDDSASVLDDATVVGTTPISTVALKDVVFTKKAFKKNNEPCGACQARKKKCVLVSSDPRLCDLCQRREIHQCPPHVSGQAVRDVYNSGISPKKTSSSQKPDQDGFVYEYTGE